MYVDVNGVRLRYDVSGRGAPVLLLHGWGGCIETVEPVAAFLRAAHTVYALDFPGHGQSGEPLEPWSVTEYTEHLRAFMRSQGLVKCDVIAHSFGGRVSILLAGQYPECVGRLLLCDSAGLLPKRPLSYYIKVYAYKAAKVLQKTPLGRIPGLSAYVSHAGSSDYRSLSPVMRASFSRIVNQDLAPYLSAIQAPTLLIWGENDQETPLYMGKVMERAIPDSALIVFEGAGHYAYLDDLPRFNAIVASFMGG